MTVETYPEDLEKEKRRRASTVSGGIFLICLGVLLFTGWWWPGIMFAIGLSGGAELVFRGKTLRGIGTLVFFLCHPYRHLDYSEIRDSLVNSRSNGSDWDWGNCPGEGILPASRLSLV